MKARTLSIEGFTILGMAVCILGIPELLILSVSGIIISIFAD